VRFLPILLLLTVITAGTRPCAAATPPGDAPRREVRAVWLTTVGALDWPSTTDTALQRRSLGEMIDRLASAGFNTIFFQVRGRGDAVYRPGLEPWSHVMTGTPGADPGWDPLEFAIAGAHARGMELHAWFNTYFVRGVTAPPPPTRPPHVINAHRNWVRRYGNDWWLDPGEPGVGEYLAAVAMDIATRYDIDGLQMDYIRYPGRSFGDDATYKKYGDGAPRDRWRRENVTALLARLKEELRRRAPAVKLGVTPIGIYRNPPGVRGLESYSDVFQDSYEWVRRGIVDYVAPQLYWPIGGGGPDPDFSGMVREWRRETPGRHLYAGIGSYKPEVLAQGTRPVEVARAEGADGEAFFRYGSLGENLPLGDVYSAPALPPAMPWKDGTIPDPPESVRVVTGADGSPRLRWSLPASSADCRFAAVYAHDPGDDHPRLLAVLPAGVDGFPLGSAEKQGRTYAVTLVSRSGMESPTAGTSPATAAATLPETVPGAGRPGALRVGVPAKASGSRIFFIPYSIRKGGRVTVLLTGPGSSAPVRLFEGERGPGGYVLSVDMSRFGAGEYRCSVRLNGDEAGRDFRVRE